MGQAWEISELITIIGSLLGCFAFIYAEIKSAKKDLRDEMLALSNARKSETDQVKIDLLAAITDLKMTLKNDLFGHKGDLKIDLNDLRSSSTNDVSTLRSDIMALSDRIARLEGTLLSYRDKGMPF